MNCFEFYLLLIKSHTLQLGAYWEVDLESDIEIKEVKIYNVGNPEKLSDSVVSLRGSDDEVIAEYNLGPSVTWDEFTITNEDFSSDIDWVQIGDDLPVDVGDKYYVGIAIGAVEDDALIATDFTVNSDVITWSIIECTNESYCPLDSVCEGVIQTECTGYSLSQCITKATCPIEWLNNTVNPYIDEREQNESCYNFWNYCRNELDEINPDWKYPRPTCNDDNGIEIETCQIAWLDNETNPYDSIADSECYEFWDFCRLELLTRHERYVWPLPAEPTVDDLLPGYCCLDIPTEDRTTKFWGDHVSKNILIMYLCSCHSHSSYNLLSHTSIPLSTVQCSSF